MSIWYTIKDKEDVSLSLDGKSVDVCFTGDHNGNIYVEIPVEFVKTIIDDKKHKECIECPECGKAQFAEVLHTDPWWSYVHTCIGCKYIIMESEWICIAKEEIKK